MIYICGDSFCVPDPDYGAMWVELLAQEFPVTNLAQIASTNLLIARQVDQAIAARAEFVIVHGTAVTRAEKRVGDHYVPFSYHTASKTTTPFSEHQLHVLKEYYTEFFDLDLAIYQNKITIENTLQKLQDSGTPFLFDQGGFEHARFGPRARYFERYDQHRSAVNLWDYSVTRDYRPYYHIVDLDIHRRVANYYAQQIKDRI